MEIQKGKNNQLFEMFRRASRIKDKDGFETGKNIYPNGAESVYQNEIQAYKRQFAFDAGSISGLSSAGGSASSLSGIKRSWLLGISNNGVYLYANILVPGILGSTVRQAVEMMKKEGQ